MEKQRAGKLVLTLLIFLVLAINALSVSFAHGDEPSEVVSQDSEGFTIDFSSPVFYISITSILLIAITIILLVAGRKFAEHHKRILFSIIFVSVSLSTIYLAGFTIYENISSETGGPVHWHADYQIWACGERLDLVDPGLSGKIGTPLLHEHNDDRIHLEGTLGRIEDANLGKFFEVIGGELEEGHLVYPTGETIYNYENGDLCQDSSQGNLKVYVNGRKIENFESYVFYPDPSVPPGDCIVIDFSSGNSETTDKICESWKAQEWTYDNFQRREVTIGEYTWR